MERVGLIIFVIGQRSAFSIDVGSSSSSHSMIDNGRLPVLEQIIVELSNDGAI